MNGQVFKYLYASSHGLKFLGNNYFYDPGQGTKIQIKCCQNTKNLFYIDACFWIAFFKSGNYLLSKMLFDLKDTEDCLVLESA